MLTVKVGNQRRAAFARPRQGAVEQLSRGFAEVQNKMILVDEAAVPM